MAVCRRADQCHLLSDAGNRGSGRVRAVRRRAKYAKEMKRKVPCGPAQCTMGPLIMKVRREQSA